MGDFYQFPPVKGLFVYGDRERYCFRQPAGEAIHAISPKPFLILIDGSDTVNVSRQRAIHGLSDFGNRRFIADGPLVGNGEAIGQSEQAFVIRLPDRLPSRRSSRPTRLFGSAVLFVPYWMFDRLGARASMASSHIRRYGHGFYRTTKQKV
jgi:hypothetical protein